MTTSLQLSYNCNGDDMKKGFTLIELICVITILGLIALIAIPTVNTMINSSKEKALQEQINLIEKTAKNYMTRNYNALPSRDGGSSCVSIEQMKQAGFLSDEDIKNPTDEAKTLTGSVKVVWEKNKYTYTYSEKTC